MADDNPLHWLCTIDDPDDNALGIGYFDDGMLVIRYEPAGIEAAAFIPDDDNPAVGFDCFGQLLGSLLEWNQHLSSTGWQAANAFRELPLSEIEAERTLAALLAEIHPPTRAMSVVAEIPVPSGSIAAGLLNWEEGVQATGVYALRGHEQCQVFTEGASAGRVYASWLQEEWTRLRDTTAGV